MKKLIYIIIFIVLIPASGLSQLNFKLSYNGYSDDNLFRSPEPIQDFLSDINIGASFRIKDSGFYLYNNLYLLSYNENSDRNFFINNLGFSDKISIGENQFSNLFFGGSWNLRTNQDDYDYYNYSQLYGYTNVQLYTNIFLLKGGYNYRWRNYTNWTDLSNHLHNAFLQINKSFPTRTTIILETGFGNKSFIGKDSITTTITTGQGQGRRSGSTEISNEIEKALNTSQINLLARLTQSLSDKIGLYIQYHKQISIDDKTSYQNFDDYYQDDELFDDPFTYESDNISSQLTLMLPKLYKIILNGSYSDKRYISEIALLNEDTIIETNDIRVDNQLRLFTTITKTFMINKDWFNSIKFDMSYAYTNNESNSYWYNYENSIISCGIQLNF
jgi:hypothetical protein